ncbi:MarR family winged helix-turn-helix transcriptional regulator [Aurantivibrio infirmus]
MLDYKDHEGLGFLITDVSRRLRHAFQVRIIGSELTLAQARALLYLSRIPGLRQVELAEVLELQPITVARLIDQLESTGLVERRPDPSDRRAYKLYQTKKADRYITDIERVITGIRADALADLNPEQVDMVFNVLHRMRDNLQDG